MTAPAPSYWSPDRDRFLQLKPTHMLVVAATQAGKTFYVNELHRKFRRRSVFVDTKGIDPIWGAKVRTLRPLNQVALKGQKLVYDPPRLLAGIDFEKARADLEHFWGKVQALAQGTRWTSDRPPWIQLVIDEAQVWLDECGDLIEDMAARGLGMGLRLILITQYPAGLNGKLGTRIRNNLETRIVLRQGDEGRRCIQGWQWPVNLIIPWTEQKFHFASYAPGLGWRVHCPIGGRPCALHPKGSSAAAASAPAAASPGPAGPSSSPPTLPM